jgi:hypothetical protein
MRKRFKTAHNSRFTKLKLRKAANVVCNAGRSENYMAAAIQPGIVPGQKRK